MNRDLDTQTLLFRLPSDLPRCIEFTVLLLHPDDSPGKILRTTAPFEIIKPQLKEGKSSDYSKEIFVSSLDPNLFKTIRIQVIVSSSPPSPEAKKPTTNLDESVVVVAKEDLVKIVLLPSFLEEGKEKKREDEQDDFLTICTAELEEEKLEELRRTESNDDLTDDELDKTMHELENIVEKLRWQNEDLNEILVKHQRIEEEEKIRSEIEELRKGKIYLRERVDELLKQQRKEEEEKIRSEIEELRKGKIYLRKRVDDLLKKEQRMAEVVRKSKELENKVEELRIDDNKDLKEEEEEELKKGGQEASSSNMTMQEEIWNEVKEIWNEVEELTLENENLKEEEVEKGHLRKGKKEEEKKISFQFEARNKELMNEVEEELRMNKDLKEKLEDLRNFLLIRNSTTQTTEFRSEIEEEFPNSAAGLQDNLLRTNTILSEVLDRFSLRSVVPSSFIARNKTLLLRFLGFIVLGVISIEVIREVICDDVEESFMIF